MIHFSDSTIFWYVTFCDMSLISHDAIIFSPASPGHCCCSVAPAPALFRRSVSRCPWRFPFAIPENLKEKLLLDTFGGIWAVDQTISNVIVIQTISNWTLERTRCQDPPGSLPLLEESPNAVGPPTMQRWSAEGILFRILSMASS